MIPKGMKSLLFNAFRGTIYFEEEVYGVIGARLGNGFPVGSSLELSKIIITTYDSLDNSLIVIYS